jgi:CRISPR/Cas system-associated endonuclease/helicase Cas3
MLINNEYFHSSDLALVTALSLSFKILETEKESSSRLTFLFENSDELSDFIERYWRGEVLINPIEYFNQLKVIKTLIYSKE